jgi:hypothetical protein
LRDFLVQIRVRYIGSLFCLQLLVATSCWLVYCINVAHSADCPYLWWSNSRN